MQRLDPQLIAKAREEILNKKGFIIDMDGVIYYRNVLLPGVKQFVDFLQAKGKNFLFLTNSSERTPRELSYRLSQKYGLQIPPEHFYTSGLSTAAFMASQSENKTCYVIGESGLVNALYNEGFDITDVNAEFVVIGETRNYSYDQIEKAVMLVRNGAKLIGTNLDLVDKVENGFVPACGSLVSPIELASEKKCYFVGKPNPLIMRLGLSRLKCKNEDTVIIGDRMDTDVIAGLESDIDTVLLLSGVTSEKDISKFAFRPHYIVPSMADLFPPTDLPPTPSTL